MATHLIAAPSDAPEEEEVPSSTLAADVRRPSRVAAQLQVRDNAQRTRFVLVWSSADGQSVTPATSRTFRTIREALAEGVARFGVLPIRQRQITGL
ncbi:hypothetical protein [Paraburkholderia sp. BL10I2N1]|uniref:hypothetical protein n=1 Tax=Paraburkholderia sp. BL10I2N1 TaxID=1938796 RepID=UPI00105D34A8|nr:hypothetical protein [Paraburkholderia sp. BL10I2N1]TDN63749.1 hypothetical protein B0G77_7431 [Paraburkholderia sp. BL10I2N1]